MKISEKRKKEIKKLVNKYCKDLEIKDEEGNITENRLQNTHDTLLELYKQPWFLDLPHDEERLLAKQYFKDNLPWKEWREFISSTPGALAGQMEDFQERYDPNYRRKRKTAPGGSYYQKI